MARESRPRKGTTKTPRSLKRKRTGKAAAETKSVDINDEDYNIRSSQSTQLLTPTEGTSKAPEKRGKGKTTAETESVDINDEDYNIRSPERTQLLTQIKRILNDASVLSAFWACCQLADMNCLQELATSTSHRKLMTYCQKPLSKLLSQWAQRPQLPESETVLQRSEGSKKRKLNSDSESSVPWSVNEKDKCRKRDDYGCVLTRKKDPQTAHIFPHCLLQPRPNPDRNHDIWEHLALFWDEGRINTWKDKIFSNSRNGVENCFNLICLSPDAHAAWNKGLFALKPLKLSRDQKTLTVQFFWQVPGDYKPSSEVDLLTETSSSKDVDLAGGHFLHRLESDGTTSRIHSGETFTFTTKDPENVPLPSLELLDMQWVLQRLVGMCGAAEWPSLDEIDDDTVDDDNGCIVPDYADYRVTF